MAFIGQLGRSVTLPTKKGFRVFRLDGTLVGTVWMFAGMLRCSSQHMMITPKATMRGVLRKLRQLAHRDPVGDERPFKGWFEGTRWICRSCHQPEPIPGYVDRRTRTCSLCDEMGIDLAEEREEDVDWGEREVVLSEAKAQLDRMALEDACAE